MITSDELLSDRALPVSATFIGGGVISFELGHLYARAGIKVMILEALPQLLPAVVATYEGDIVGRNIVEGSKHGPNYEGMATAVYTVPALAAVGLTEAAPTQKELAVDVPVNDMLGRFSAKTDAETVAWSKIIVDRPTDRIVGAHFVDRQGQELINVFGLTIKFGITAHQLKDHVYAYPTFSADINHMFAHTA